MPSRFLQKQLEEERFLHALAYVENEASGLKKLSISELARLNQHLVGHQDEVWRAEAVHVQLPSGTLHHFNVVVNPMQRAREILGDAQVKAGNHDFLEAATDLYSQMVLAHLFKDANRRTAVLAVFWILQSAHKSIDAQNLLDFSIGDLRNSGDLAKLRNHLQSLIF